MSGQGGWSLDDAVIQSADHIPQLEQAFKNIDRIVQDAGGRGRGDAHTIKVYTTSLTDEICERARKQVQGDTLLQVMYVPALGEPDMVAEVQAEVVLD